MGLRSLVTPGAGITAAAYLVTAFPPLFACLPTQAQL